MGSQEDHFDVDINIDPYLGAQIEVLEGDLMGTDSQFNSYQYSCLGDGVENDSTRNSRLNEYQQLQKQVTDCFMGVLEEANSGPTRFCLGDGDDSMDQFMDFDFQQELHSQRQNTIDVERERQFIKGWEDIKRKIVVMNNRIGTKTSVHAVFQNAIYLMGTNKLNGPRTNPESEIDLLQGGEVSDSENSKESSVVERDHRYAAVILTQKESSSDVRDHQYNQVSCSSNPENVSTSFIKSRYKREQQFVKYLDSLFSMKQKLETVAGANITLEVSYEHCLFNSRNFKTADATLSNNRKKLFRVPVVPTMEFPLSNESLENYAPNLPQILMMVERVPAVGEITPGIHIRYVKMNNGNKPNAAATILRSSPDNLDTENSLTPMSIRVDPEFLSLDHSYGLSPSIMSSSASPERMDLENISTNKNYMESSQQEESISADLNYHYVEDTSPLNNDSTLTSLTKNVSSITSTTQTQTQPVCGLCGVIGPLNSVSNSTSNLISSELWLRCFNPFCHFMVHPTCLGFRVNSTSEMTMLPPYLCPEHR